ncbi:MAG: hypothetical protein VX262_09560, partial [Acidobacteriota bacterium]|nr:hypothetical protein [Acidobacteriota bacterium]
MSPWKQFKPAIFETCEPTLDGWIAHPAEAASAIAYLLVATLLWHHFGYRDRRLFVRYLPFALGIIGLTSILFHISYAALFQLVDVAAIPLFMGYICAATVVHRQQADVTLFPRLFWSITTISVLLVALNLAVGFAVVIVQGCAIIWFWWTDPFTQKNTDARRAILLLVSGAMLLGIDHAAIGCVTGANAHLIQPHSIWHLLSAASGFFFYRAERQLEQRWYRPVS